MIVTTRQRDVALTVNTIEPYMLKFLSDDDCWLLFKTHAIKTQVIDMHPNLELLREKVIDRCKGLPLAARTLGGLLCCKPTNEWKDILDSKMWSAYEEKDGVFPVLRLSYHYLPSELKKCFAYCVIFPKDYEFTEKELTLLWVAEGLIQQTKENKNMNDVGSRNFQELVSRSLFQVSSNHGSQFIMHDLVHELAQQIAGDTCLRLESILEHSEKVLRARHLSYQQRQYNCMKSFELFHKAKHVRTFFSFSSTPYYMNSYLANGIIHQLLKFKKLRVLSLNGYNIVELPDSIGDLKHLRYLDVSNNMIRYLPESICSLYNLQMLCLKHCDDLKKLPSKMENLVNLCYLDITNCDKLKEMPIGLKELKSLQILSIFCVSKNYGCKLRELINFKDLRGTLCIYNLKDVVDAHDAKANLNEKNLDVLILQWGPFGGGFRNADIEKRVLDMLQPHQNLKELRIIRYAGNVFSKWLEIPSFSCMTLLTLVSCERCTRLPTVGQLPSLKVLEIRGMKGIESVGAEFYGNTRSKVFPSLESLTFKNMQEWKNWTSFEVSDEQVEVFPCLSELSLWDCPKLIGKLPDHLPSLKKLIIIKCGELNDVSSSFPKLYKLKISGSRALDGDGHEKLITKNWPCTIEELSLKNCSMIERLPITLCNLKHLKMLTIFYCSNLVSLPAALLFSSVLEELSIKKCDKVQYLVNEVEKSSNSNSLSTSVLKKLSILDCPKLEFVAKTLPSSLKTLAIEFCCGLKFVAETFLDNMELESIEVIGCDNFQWLPEGLNSLSNLRKIKIMNCPCFLSFPQGGLLSPNLADLSLSCENLEILPNGICNLTSLTYLSISLSPRIINFVPEDGFMPNIRYLYLGGDKILRALMEWGGLDRLTSLKTLNFWGEDSEIEEMMINLPNSLTCLLICKFPMLTILPSFPISLTKFYITCCPNLEYISSSSNYFQALTSLETLVIYSCPKLKCLPKEGLPPSLGYFNIEECALLEKRCKKDSGKDWPKIANIPRVEIREKIIYEPEVTEDEESS